MDTHAYTSRVASLLNDLQRTDWERKLGRWATTLVALTIVWWFVRRVRNISKAAVGEREMPAVVPDSASAILFPLDLIIVAVFAVWTYLAALAVWRLVGRKYRVDSVTRRFVTLFAAGTIGLVGILFVVAVAVEISEGSQLVTTVSENLAESRDFLTDWVPYLPIPAVTASLVASWRRGEYELTVRRRQLFAVAAVAIVVAPAVLGAAGVSGAAADDATPDIQQRSESSDIVDQMDDGLTGPTIPELDDSTLSRGEFRAPTTLLGCGDVNRTAYQIDTYLYPEYPAATQVNISDPSDTDTQYIELAPYRDDGEIIHGRYAFRVASDEWKLLETWYANPEYEGGDHWNASTGAYHTYDESSGIVAMENTEAATFGFDLVNEDGEIVRVQYRLCRPDT